MSKRGNTAAIGAFVVGAIILLVVGILAFGSGTLFSDKTSYVLYFDGNLKGLNVGAPVAFRGVRVGEVKNISVYVDTNTLQFAIPVVIEIDSQRFHHVGPEFAAESEEQNLKKLIDQGMRAKLDIQSIVTAQLMIQLDMFPDQPARLRGNGDMLEIPTIPSGFERFFQALEEISFRKLVENINQAVSQLGNMLDDQELERALASIRTAADDVSLLAGNLNREMIPMVQSIKQTSDDAGVLIRDFDDDIDPTMGEARAALMAIRQAMEQADRTLRTIDSLAEGVGEQSAFRYEISNALKEIAAAANSLRALSDMLRQQPDALLRGKGNLGGN